MELIYPAKLDNLREILAKIENFADNAGCSITQSMQLVLLSEELIVNVMSYAYEGGKGHIKISLDDVDSERLRMTITDEGVEFNPLEQEDPDTTLGLEEREVGGLGIFFVKQLSETLTYTRTEDSNVLSLTFLKVRED